MSADLAWFWAAAASLVLVCMLVAFAPVLRRREAAEPAAARIGTTVWVACAIAVPAIAGFVYLRIGAPQAILAANDAPTHRMNQVDMAQAVAALAARLEAQPQDIEGWFMLARSHQAMERWNDSAAAYRRALALAPDDTQLLADLADVLASAAGGDLTGEPAALIDRALGIDPKHAKSLALKAVAEYRGGHYRAALAHWETLAATQPADSEAASLAQRGIGKAREALAVQSSLRTTPAQAAPGTH
nr:tetratricopeptide repeat protein [uncultured Caldimonas sp.]